MEGSQLLPTLILERRAQLDGANNEAWQAKGEQDAHTATGLLAGGHLARRRVLLRMVNVHWRLVHVVLQPIRVRLRRHPAGGIARDVVRHNER